jgi:broad specificity phosphatase PhoE
MLRLTLVRHASTALNEQRRYQGWVDPPLSERGRAEAERLRQRLRRGRYDQVLCSDLLRCTQTAALALPDTAPQRDARLRECGFGEWDGWSYDQCLAAEPERVRAWIDDPSAQHPPGGEAFAGFARRVDEALEQLAGPGSVLLVTHGGPIRRILCRTLELQWRQTLGMHLSPCSITRLALHREGAQLLTLNDTCHLDA